MTASTPQPSVASRRQVLVAWLGLIFAVAVTVMTLHRYVRDADEAYQMLNAQDWRNAPFAPLSAYIGHLWGAVFGFGWVQMRVLSMILNLATIGFGGYFCYRIVRNLPRAIWLTAGAVVLYALTNDHEQKYDWDTFATLSATAVAVLLLCYGRRPRLWLMAVTGVTVAAGIMMRMPSAAIFFVPVVAIFLYKNDTGVSRWAALGVYVTAVAAGLLIMICALYGTPARLIATFKANAIAAHSSAYLVQIFLHSSRIITEYVVLLAAAFFVIYKCRNLRGDTALGLGGVMIVVLLFASYVVRYTSGLYDYPYTGLMIYTLMFGIFLNYKSLRSGMAPDMFILLISGVAVVVGSNCGFNRMIVYPFMPIVAGYILTCWPLWARKAQGICFAGFTIAMLMLPVANLRVFFEVNYNFAAVEYDGGKTRGAYFDRTDVRWFDEVVPVIEHYKNLPGYQVNVMSEYVDGFLVEFLTDTRNPITRHDWRFGLREDDPETVERFIDQMNAAPSPAALVVVLSPAYDGKWSTRDFTALDTLFTLTDSGAHYRVYTKP